MPTTKHIRSAVLAMAMAGPLWAGSQPADAPTRLVVAFSPGGAYDAAARVVAEGLSKLWNKPVIVDNKPGANGAIGLQHVAKSAPDGRTLLFGGADSFAIAPHIEQKLPYDVLKDFAPVAYVGALPSVLTARTGLPANNMAELRGLAKAKPEGVTYASWGIGSMAHIAMGQLESVGGLKLLHVPYNGVGPAVAQLQGNQVDTMLLAVPVAISLAKGGRLKILGLGSTTRLGDFPEIPTLAEQGFAGVNSETWAIVYAPAALPQDLLAKYASDLRKVLADPTVTAKLKDQGFYTTQNPPENLNEFAAKEYARWGATARAANIPVKD